MSEPLRMPISVASHKGVSGVVAAAADRRVILTNHGRPVAVVDSAERVDDDLRKLREARLAVVDAAADLTARRSGRMDLDDVCARLGVDAGEVRRRADGHQH